MTKTNQTDAQERKQVGIHVNVKLWRKFRARCIEEGTQAGHKVEELIAEYLGEKKSGKMVRGKGPGKA